MTILLAENQNPIEALDVILYDSLNTEYDRTKIYKIVKANIHF